MSKVKTGVVRFYNQILKKGLIKCDDGYEDITVYNHHLEKFGIESLRKDDSVKFEIQRAGNTHAILAMEFLEE